MKVIIVGGGTGGHVYPLIPIGKELKKRNFEVVFVGRKGRIEDRIFTSYGFDMEFVSASQFDFNIKTIFLFIFNFFNGVAESFRIIKKHKPDAVLGGGGYVSLPVLIASILTNVPIFIYEQNIIPGRTNLLFKRFAIKIFLGFPDANNIFKGKGMFVGNPVRKEVIGVEKRVGLDFFDFEDKFTLLVFGGSGGAYKLNKTVFSIIEELLKFDIQIIFITGEKFYKDFKDKIVHKSLRMFPYLEHMGYAYAAADLAITRGGAMTLSELVLNEVYSIVVPFPYARDNHQYFNAKYFESLGCVEVLEENSLNEKLLLDRILELKEKLRIIKMGCSSLYPKDSEVKIVDTIEEIINKHG